MKIEKLIEFDTKLRQIGISGVYGPWDKNNQYFSIGEGEDNINVYVGNIPENENIQPTPIDKKKLETKNFDIIFIKNDERTENNIIDFQDIENFYIRKKQ